MISLPRSLASGGGRRGAEQWRLVLQTLCFSWREAVLAQLEKHHENQLIYIYIRIYIYIINHINIYIVLVCTSIYLCIYIFTYTLHTVYLSDSFCFFLVLLIHLSSFYLSSYTPWAV